MSLPMHFQFSQSSLQAYADCPRRFQLQYVERVAWPAPEAQPSLEDEKHLRLGLAFHRLVHRHLLGMSPEQLSVTITDADLQHWWRGYLAALAPQGVLADLPPHRYPEFFLSAPLGDYRLIARYDLVAVSVGQRAVIVDWKTYQRRPRREHLLTGIQTRLYPYLLVRAGAELNAGQPFLPSQVEMVYWFAHFPDQPEWFRYHPNRFQEDNATLQALVAEISSRDPALPWPRTRRPSRCRHCRYRSLCAREGEWSLEPDTAETDEVDKVANEVDRISEADNNPTVPGGLDNTLGAFDFEQIAEIAF